MSKEEFEALTASESEETLCGISILASELRTDFSAARHAIIEGAIFVLSKTAAPTIGQIEKYKNIAEDALIELNASPLVEDEYINQLCAALKKAKAECAKLFKTPYKEKKKERAAQNVKDREESRATVCKPEKIVLKEGEEYPALLSKVVSEMTPDEEEFGFTWVVTNDKGKPQQEQGNVDAFLNRWGIRIFYNAFSGKVCVEGVPGSTTLDDRCFVDIRMSMDHMGLLFKTDYLWDYLRARAATITVHPVRDKFAELESQWDGTPRIDTWLIAAFGAQDSPYTRQIGAKWLTAGVRRVRRPGCKMDYILTAVGAQGLGKSEVFKQLGYETYFSDSVHVGEDEKSVIEKTRGKHVVELAELKGLSKREAAEVKAFGTRTHDTARMSYGREAIEVPRQFILASSTNNDEFGIDPTGARRWWSFDAEKADVEWIKAERDQLWAEAAVRESAGETLYLTADAEAIAKAEQKSRYAADDLQTQLIDAVTGRIGVLPTAEVFRLLNLGDAAPNPQRSRSVKAAMTIAGWKMAVVRVGVRKKQVRGYVKGLEGVPCADTPIHISVGSTFKAIPSANYDPDELSQHCETPSPDYGFDPEWYKAEREAQRAAQETDGIGVALAALA
jgi:hypothetical protein